MVVAVVTRTLARWWVAILERGGNLYGVAPRIGLAWWWWGVACLWLQVRRWRRSARRRRRRWRLGLELLVGAALHVAQHKRDALARLIGFCRLCMYYGLPYARRVLNESARVLG